jgi:hypothetical protein
VAAVLSANPSQRQAAPTPRVASKKEHGRGGSGFPRHLFGIGKSRVDRIHVPDITNWKKVTEHISGFEIFLKIAIP